MMYATMEKPESYYTDVAVKYAQKQIEDLYRKIHECDYYEDVNGCLVYCPGSYADEKREYTYEREKWENILTVLKEHYVPYDLRNL